ncbi:MAG: sigma-70 family RNA polymerase sigma factor [Phycisphaerales bacterium]|nr:MAG: sigma-70 family RNA polymerase sigma factor [Phycisphaerales bacterium]
MFPNKSLDASAVRAARVPGVGAGDVPEHRTDETLLQAYRDGDAGAFRELIERHHDALLRFLIRFMGDRQAAEDVFQDAFLQIHLSADTFDTSRRFKPWLFTIAANKGRDYLRRHSRRPTVDLSAPISADADGGGRTFLDLMQVDVEAPHQALDDRERDEMVQRAIDAMPDHLREILLLAYFQRMSYANIADALEIPLGTVKSRLHAAVASFARQWAALTDPGDSENAANADA